MYCNVTSRLYLHLFFFSLFQLTKDIKQDNVTLALLTEVQTIVKTIQEPLVAHFDFVRINCPLHRKLTKSRISPCRRSPNSTATTLKSSTPMQSSLIRPTRPQRRYHLARFVSLIFKIFPSLSKGSGTRWNDRPRLCRLQHESPGARQVWTTPVGPQERCLPLPRQQARQGKTYF